ncbi:MAG: glycosyltransferase family 4 protein [Gammaproteobacteria bacterium]|nr:glycosyltransferase family 4 protein [Gammaproteobacteria bacterium]
MLVGTLLVSVALVGAILRYASRLGLIHAPNERSSHSTLVPHGGGLGIVVTFLLALSILLITGGVSGVEWVVLVGCGGLIAAVGFWDDVGHATIRWRLLVQFACVGAGVWLLGGFFTGQADGLIYGFGILGFGLSVLLLVWWLNLFNFMDGIDGLAGLETIFIALGVVTVLWLGDWLSASGMSLEAVRVATLLTILAVSVLGFLVYNWSPARIFMGDVGSTFLGFVLGVIALMSVANGVVSFWTWLILGGVFWVDATLTLMRRMVAGERWYQAHRSHAYQHAVMILSDSDSIAANKVLRRYLGVVPDHPHRTVCMLILAINLCWLLPLACLAMIAPEFEILILALSWAPLVWMAFRLNAGKQDLV